MGNCKYWKKCKKYDSNSLTCTRTNGMYYAGNRPAGCYRDLKNNEKEVLK